MKKGVLWGVCAVVLAGVAVFGFSLAIGGGVSYEFVQKEFIEDYNSGIPEAIVSDVIANHTTTVKPMEFGKISVGQKYVAAVTTIKATDSAAKEDAASHRKVDALVQAEEQLIRKTTGKDFTKAWAYVSSEKFTVEAKPNSYAWVAFKPQTSKITGTLFKKEGGKVVEEKYVEIVFPKANPENAKTMAGEFTVKNETDAPKTVSIK